MATAGKKGSVSPSIGRPLKLQSRNRDAVIPGSVFSHAQTHLIECIRILITYSRFFFLRPGPISTHRFSLLDMMTLFHHRHYLLWVFFWRLTSWYLFTHHRSAELVIFAAFRKGRRQNSTIGGEHYNKICFFISFLLPENPVKKKKHTLVYFFS